MKASGTVFKDDGEELNGTLFNTVPELPFNKFQIQSIESFMCKIHNIMTQVLGHGLPLEDYMYQLKTSYRDSNHDLPTEFCQEVKGVQAKRRKLFKHRDPLKGVRKAQTF